VHVLGNLTAVRYRDEIIQPHTMHVIDRQRELFQQDNARSHTACLTMDYQEKRSFRRLYTRILQSRFCRRKRDSSLSQIMGQFWNVQLLNLLHQWTLSRLCNCVNTTSKYGLMCLIPCCRSQLRSVCELILRDPGIPTAVVDAKRFDSVEEKPGCNDLAQESLCEVFHSSGGH
jgi:hypothetical protein